MKTLKLIALGILFLVTTNVIQAQVSVNVNIGRPPAWGPAGYSAVNYYYIPDIQSYYDVRTSQFIYFGRGRWIRSRNLPSRYRNYDLYNGYKVVLNDYHGSTPYTHFKSDRVKYHNGYKGSPQRTIGARTVIVNKNSSHHRNNNDRYNNNRYNNKNRNEFKNHDRGNNDHERGNRGHENRKH